MVVTLYDHDIIQANVQYLTVRLASTGSVAVYECVFFGGIL